MGMNAQRIAQDGVCDGRRFGRILKYDQSGRILRMLRRRGDRHYGARQVSVLSELTVGERGILVSLELPENVQNHLMHMGFVPGSCVTALRRAPAGDPTVYSVDGLEIALRHETAEAIRVRALTAKEGEGQSAGAQGDTGIQQTAKTDDARDIAFVEAAK
jgi:ferrous iron transport protein A